MLVFSNYENFDSGHINTLQTDLNNYSVSMESLIGLIDNSFNINDYNFNVNPVTSHNNELMICLGKWFK